MQIHIHHFAYAGELQRFQLGRLRVTRIRSGRSARRRSARPGQDRKSTRFKQARRRHHYRHLRDCRPSRQGSSKILGGGKVRRGGKPGIEGDDRGPGGAGRRPTHRPWRLEGYRAALLLLSADEWEASTAVRPRAAGMPLCAQPAYARGAELRVRPSGSVLDAVSARYREAGVGPSPRSSVDALARPSNPPRAARPRRRSSSRRAARRRSHSSQPHPHQSSPTLEEAEWFFHGPRGARACSAGAVDVLTKPLRRRGGLDGCP